MEEKFLKCYSKLEMGCKKCGSGILELKVKSGASEVDAELEDIILDKDKSRGNGVVLIDDW